MTTLGELDGRVGRLARRSDIRDAHRDGEAGGTRTVPVSRRNRDPVRHLAGDAWQVLSNSARTAGIAPGWG